MDNLLENNLNFKYSNLYDEISYFQAIENLKDDNCEDFIKIFSMINLEKIESFEDFKIFINHLINHSTPLREMCALKLEDFSIKYEDYFLDEFSKNKILNAIIDINPNVSRVMCLLLEQNKKLNKELEEKIIENILTLLNEIQNLEEDNKQNFTDITKNRKNHAKNKKIFSLYWLLEALGICLSEKNNSKVLKILEKTINFCDYTIREKTAKILAKYPSISKKLLQIAKCDENFYVKNQVYGKIVTD